MGVFSNPIGSVYKVIEFVKPTALVFGTAVGVKKVENFYRPTLLHRYCNCRWCSIGGAVVVLIVSSV